jgi:hypothetical protein
MDDVDKDAMRVVVVSIVVVAILLRRPLLLRRSSSIIMGGSLAHAQKQKNKKTKKNPATEALVCGGGAGSFASRMYVCASRDVECCAVPCRGWVAWYGPSAPGFLPAA